MLFDTTTRAPARNPQTPNTLSGSVFGPPAVVGDEPKAASGSGAGEACALPRQNENNSNGLGTEPRHWFSSAAAKSAYVLQINAVAFVRRFGLDRVGFLTLTFPDHVLDFAEASRRFNSLATGVLRERYAAYLRVAERQKSGRWHFHLLVACGSDIRTGADFDAFERRDYRSASPALRAEWRFWRDTAPLYSFGRTELLPLKSTAHAVGRYLGKYISKHLSARLPCDKGVRLVSAGGEREAINRFSWFSPRATTLRRQIGGFVRMLHAAGAISAPTREAMAARFGPHWFYYWRDSITAFCPEPEAEGVSSSPSVSLGEPPGAGEGVATKGSDPEPGSAGRSGLSGVPIPPRWVAAFQALKRRPSGSSYVLANS